MFLKVVQATEIHPIESSDSGLDVETWLRSLASVYSPHEISIIRRASDLAQKSHSAQIRASGEPYFQHVLAAANILASLKMDHEAIAAALLHDVAEDTETTLEDIRIEFGDTIASLVDGVTKMDVIDSLPGHDPAMLKEHAQAESLRKMLLAMAEDVRVVLIKLADRLHNMRTLSCLRPQKQKRIARETLDIFAPLANRLGIWQLKWELEDLSFRYLEPDTYKRIAKMLEMRRVERQEYLDSFKQYLEQKLHDAHIVADIVARPKHIYSIWKKMQRKNLDYHELYDVLGVRVLVKDIAQCYAVLGVVHSEWNYVRGEFDDYIATPKENNYKSLHTAVIGPLGQTVEVQIRTHDMHAHAEHGVASHWAYKEGASHDGAFEDKLQWMRQLLEWKEEVSDASDFVDRFKSEVHADRVYVITPQGKIVDLELGATPVDFAYHIHTEVGHRCRGAKVNQLMVPLTRTLATGDHVEILTVKRGGPSRDWLNPHQGHVKTARARSKIQHWLRLQDFEQNLVAGKHLVDRELDRLGLDQVNTQKLSEQFNCTKVDSFYAGVGRNEIKLGQVVRTAERLLNRKTIEASPETPKPSVVPEPREAGDINVQGVGNLMTQLARCCKPIPGESIGGYITRGAGVSIHRRDCSNYLRLSAESPQRLIEVSWGIDPDKDYSVDIEVIAYDRHGLLHDVTSVFSNNRVNLLAANTLSDKKSNQAKMRLTIEINNIDDLSRVLAKISQLPNVVTARRLST
ncbi:MAG: GTP diphosphokinase [Gammaproteobacteria bacterium]|nr:GTP diphosphokinase [Gammaproteobacteria bacterium]